MKLCPECLGRGFIYSPGGYAPQLPCPTCKGSECRACEGSGLERWVGYGNSEDVRPCSVCQPDSPPLTAQDTAEREEEGSSGSDVAARGTIASRSEAQRKSEGEG